CRQHGCDPFESRAVISAWVEAFIGRAAQQNQRVARGWAWTVEGVDPDWCIRNRLVERFQLFPIGEVKLTKWMSTGRHNSLDGGSDLHGLVQRNARRVRARGVCAASQRAQQHTCTRDTPRFDHPNLSPPWIAPTTTRTDRDSQAMR